MDSRWRPPNPPGLPGVHLEYVEQGKVLKKTGTTKGTKRDTSEYVPRYMQLFSAIASENKPSATGDGLNGESTRKFTFNIIMFSAKEASKDLKKWTGKNTYMVLNSNEPFDTWRAQLIVQVKKTLKPSKLDINDNKIHFMVAHISPLPLIVASDEEYLNMLEQVGKSKDSACNVYVQELCLSTKVCSLLKSVSCLLNSGLQKCSKENDSKGDGGSMEEEEECKKKKSKKTKVCVSPLFRTCFLTIPSLPGLPISIGKCST